MERLWPRLRNLRYAFTAEFAHDRFFAIIVCDTRNMLCTYVCLQPKLPNRMVSPPSERKVSNVPVGVRRLFLLFVLV